ncbi:50S ribosomal protein L21 [Brevundimonas sp.]|uniref:50S ribosomal protein L21 n=1 Tax=Brevundimonas sp. TaxID=1871086 RepID=UPI0035AEC14E
MYAVIKTGGKQYRVQPGDVIVVEKLDGDAGADIKFDDVLMLGGDKGVTLGAPLVAGASVAASLVETRKGEKIKVFKKIRRQGYRRTNGHRQMESVLRITGISGKDESAKWDGKAETLTLAEKNARARGLAPRVEAEAPTAKAKPAARTEVAETETKAPKAEAKKAAAPKTAKADTAEKKSAAPKTEGKKAPAKKADKAGDDA